MPCANPTCRKSGIGLPPKGIYSGGYAAAGNPADTADELSTGALAQNVNDRRPTLQSFAPDTNNANGEHVAWIITKYFVTAAVVVLVSELAKRSDKLGGFVAALPLVTVMALIWLYAEKQPMEKIANHAWYTFWYVLPTLPMFLAFPVLLPRLGFWPALLVCIMITVLCFGLFALAVRRFGIELL